MLGRTGTEYREPGEGFEPPLSGASIMTIVSLILCYVCRLPDELTFVNLAG